MQYVNTQINVNVHNAILSGTKKDKINAY